MIFGLWNGFYRRDDLPRYEDFPTVLRYWEKWNVAKLSEEIFADKSKNCFAVSYSEIEQNNYDLSFSRYHLVVQAPIECEPSAIILDELQSLNKDITENLSMLHGILGSGIQIHEFRLCEMGFIAGIAKMTPVFPAKKEQDEVRGISPFEIGKGRFLKNVERSYLEKSICDRYEMTFLEAGDILLVAEGTSDFGNCVLYEGEDEKATVNRRIRIIRPDASKIEPRYLVAVLQTEYIQRQLKIFSEGSKVPRLRTEQLTEIKIPLLPLERQCELVQTLQVIDDLRDRMETSIHRAEQFAESFLQESFITPSTE